METQKIGKKTMFCRRIKNPGIYTGNINGKIIRLVDRDLYSPKDEKEAKFLMDDPEIEILCADEDEQKKENERKDVQGKVLSGQLRAKK